MKGTTQLNGTQHRCAGVWKYGRLRDCPDCKRLKKGRNNLEDVKRDPHA